jgi:hypothetical protein
MIESSSVYILLILRMWEDGSDAFCLIQVCLYACHNPFYPLSDVIMIKFQCSCLLCVAVNILNQIR